MRGDGIVSLRSGLLVVVSLAAFAACGDDDGTGGAGAGDTSSTGIGGSGGRSTASTTSTGTQAQGGGGNGTGGNAEGGSGQGGNAEGGSGGAGGGGPEGCVYLVDGANGDDGLDGGSWLTAKATVSAALDAAVAENDPNGCQVWVRAGTYLPTTDGDRTKSFQLRPNVALYGGFDGTESLLEDRDVLANVTILSGDIGVPGNNGDNSYHVILGADATRLDGFTVRDGRADGTGLNQLNGGGLYHLAGDLVIANCRFEMNSTGNGVSDGPGTVGQWGGYGGAIYQGGGTITIESSELVSNFTGNGGSDTQIGGDGGPGGAIATQAGSLTIDGSSFVGNATGNGANSQQASGGIGGSGGFGGAIAFYSSGTLIVTNSYFTQNTTGNGATCMATSGGIGGSGGYGGAIAFIAPGTLSIQGTDFFDNTTGNGGPSNGGIGGQGGVGGALSIQGNGAVAAVRTSTFTSNETGDGATGVTIGGQGGTGGAIFSSVQSGQVTIAESLLEQNGVGAGAFGNAAGGPGVGGAIHHAASGNTDLVIASVSFVENTALLGGAIFFQTSSATAGSETTIVNAVFQGNQATNEGGAILFNGNGVSAFTIANATFEGNAAGVFGGGIIYRSFSSGSPPLSLSNSILWNNTAPQGPQLWYPDSAVMGQAPLSVDDNDIQGGCTAANPRIVCGTNLNVDPLFEDVMTDLSLSASSPAKNQGDTALLPPDLADLDGDADVTESTPLDRLGAPRVAGVSVDMGAYEAP
ncbi:MAG: hypothetical protein HOV80_28930 [Polyangiaceae bacterium]|nr:hypothetical protein [Polyangiaceae bacterium]